MYKGQGDTEAPALSESPHQQVKAQERCILKIPVPTANNPEDSMISQQVSPSQTCDIGLSWESRKPLPSS